jgi:hypothetical protein
MKLKPVRIPVKSEPNVAAIRQALEIAASLVYLARATFSRAEADAYLDKVGEQLQTIGVLLGGISNQERAAS